jgi:hypothetical protein
VVQGAAAGANGAILKVVVVVVAFALVHNNAVGSSAPSPTSFPASLAASSAAAECAVSGVLIVRGGVGMIVVVSVNFVGRMWVGVVGTIVRTFAFASTVPPILSIPLPASPIPPVAVRSSPPPA